MNNELGPVIIGNSANIFASDRDACLESGMDAFITKPIDPDYLVEMLVRFLRERKSIVQDNALLGNMAAEEGPDNRYVDYESCELFRKTDAAAFGKVLKKFHDNYAPVMRELQTGGLDMEEEAFSRLLHTISGLAGSVGAYRMEDLCVRAEEKLAGEGGGPAIGFLKSNGDIIANTLSEVENYLSRH